MRQLSIRLDDDVSPLLAKHKNQNRIVNEALRLYLSDTTTGVLENIAAGFRTTAKYLKEIDSKLEYLSAQKNVGIPPTVIGTSEAKKYPNYNPPVSLEPTLVIDSQDPADNKPLPQLGDVLRENSKEITHAQDK